MKLTSGLWNARFARREDVPPGDTVCAPPNEFAADSRGGSARCRSLLLNRLQQKLIRSAIAGSPAWTSQLANLQSRPCHSPISHPVLAIRQSPIPSYPDRATTSSSVSPNNGGVFTPSSPRVKYICPR